jgi:competence protein ComEC
VVLVQPLTLLTSVAMLAGFVLLPLWFLGLPGVGLLAHAVDWPLAACAWLVELCDRPGWGYIRIGEIPVWWLCLFYGALLAWLTQAPLRARPRLGWAAGMAWLCVGLAGGAAAAGDELRCTFLAVGHGGCTVLETPDGRVLIYDAGAFSGPEATHRVVVPYLWARGVRRVDEVFLSHADLDHFNGLVELMDRFAVGQVTLTPTFADKPTPGVRLTLEELKRRGVPVRVVRAGDRLTAGPVTLDVLHPPAKGPVGVENVRSLVLLVRHADHRILLTGDLEGVGQQMVRERCHSPDADVMLAPHHGSPKANGDALAAWARPRVVVSIQGPHGPKALDAYRSVEFLTTAKDGAVTVRSRPGALTVETFVTGRRIAVRPP